MKEPMPGDLARVGRHRCIYEDPIRFACLCSAAALVFLPSIPFLLTFIVVCVAQFAPVAMLWNAAMPGWSRRWGPRVRESLVATNLSLDFTRLAACAVVGALLLVRHFDGSEVVRPLGILAAGVCLLPDLRLCRLLLPGDPAEASRRLRQGWGLRDPVLLGAILASVAVCLLDPISLLFVLLSLGILQVNTILVVLDKYLPEVETRRHHGLAAVVLEREVRRVALCLAPLALVPLRHYLGDAAGRWGAIAVAGAVVVPDLVRAVSAMVSGVSGLFRVTTPPATLIVLPKPH
jgi:hypothetical protein